METLSSSPCQLRLEVVLKYLSLSFYTRTQFLHWCKGTTLSHTPNTLVVVYWSNPALIK